MTIKPIILTVILAVPLAVSAQTTFSNTNSITINDSLNPPTKSAAYPSVITVTGLNGLVAKATVQFHRFTHGFPDDVCIALVGPGGESAVLMSNCGSGAPGASNLEITLDDDAAQPLPISTPLASGLFKPVQRKAFGYPWPAPAPATPGAPLLATFKDTNPNGDWKLCVIDDFPGNAGVIAGGWSLALATAPLPPISIARAGSEVVLSWTNTPAGLTLQAAPNLLPGTVWTNVTAAPVESGSRFHLTNSAGGSAFFYRLAL